MTRWTRDDFKYAELYNPSDKTYCTDGSTEGLVRGPATEKRYQENTDACAVTVCCITYHHEKTIRQTLESFLAQKTDFVFKVFVGEDCGGDGTADIIREYAQKYPEIIVPFLRERNMGAQRNLIDLCQHAHSPYIAFCEGDDYWIDDHKLQKQFDYLQAHEDIRMCYTNTEILAPDDWHLNGYYKHNAEGKMILPGCSPEYRDKPVYFADDIIEASMFHTSSAFFRWNYDIEIPDWYYQGVIGDIPITIMQMGMGKAACIQDVTSVYRRSNVGVFMNSSTDEHFKNTRLDYVRYLKGLRSYYRRHYEAAFDASFRKRMTLEICNYLDAAVNEQDCDMVSLLMEQYPEEMFEALHTYLGSYRCYRNFQKKLSPKDLVNLTEKRRSVYFAVPGIKLYGLIHSVVLRGKKLKHGIHKYVLGWYRFWKNSKVEKQSNLWVFSGFWKNTYMDNVKYLYETVVEHHPEIQAAWLTTNKGIYTKLKNENKPVYYMNSTEGKSIISRAAVAVTDHYVMSDYSPEWGFNAATKVVQLWHGVGFKLMADDKGVKKTTIPGLVFSSDIISQPTDSQLTKILKKLRYIILAPFRERFEEYFLFISPGQWQSEMIGDLWHIPQSCRMMAGYPRDTVLYKSKNKLSRLRIMYAPTFRYDYEREQEMVDEFLQKVPDIQKLMEEVDGEFSLRMHPHTWRNYKGKIRRVLKDYNRIVFDDNPDIYQTLGTYSIVVTDYSSLGLDFALLGRPVVFHGQDYEWYANNDAGFSVDFPNVIPGPMTKNWEETLERVREYIENPEKDRALREEKLQYFFDASVNGPDNSERIVREIKRRLGL